MSSINLNEIPNDFSFALFDSKWNKLQCCNFILGIEKIPVIGSFPVMATRSPFFTIFEEDLKSLEETTINNPLPLMSTINVCSEDGKLFLGIKNLWLYLNGFSININDCPDCHDTFITYFYLITYFLVDKRHDFIQIGLSDLLDDMLDKVNESNFDYDENRGKYDYIIDTIDKMKLCDEKGNKDEILDTIWEEED